MYHQSPQARIMAARILNSLFERKALTMPEACFAAGRGSSGNRAFKLAHNCYILIGGSREFETALNHLIQTEQVVLRKADPRLFGKDALRGLPIVDKTLTYLTPSWQPVVVTLP